MEIDFGPIIKYENVIRNACFVRAGLDTRLKADIDNVFDYKAHLQDCEKNPTIGMIARKKYITGEPMNYPEAAKRNLRFINRYPEIEALTKRVKDNISELYPKTRFAREYIINNDRIMLKSIEKIKKYTVFDRLKIALKKII